jgi:hypothetical protein
VRVWVQWSDDHGAYFDVPKTFARAILNDAREHAAKTGIATVIAARVEGDTVYIGSTARPMPMPRSVTDAPRRVQEGTRTMSEQETTVGDTGGGEEDDDDSCAMCNKTTDSDDDVPAGWFFMHVEHGGETEDEEADTIVCSLTCAKAWLDQEWGGGS